MNNTHKYLTKIDAKFLDEVSHLMQVDARNAKTRKPSQNPHMFNKSLWRWNRFECRFEKEI